MIDSIFKKEKCPGFSGAFLRLLDTPYGIISFEVERYYWVTEGAEIVNMLEPTVGGFFMLTLSVFLIT